MAQAGVELKGLREFRRDLKAVGAEWPRELRKVNRQVADDAAEWARGGAHQSGGVARKAAYSIVGASTQRSAKVRWGGRGYEFADGAFMGAKRWPQFKPWIGVDWKPLEGGEGPGRGPYGINPALSDRREDIEDAYLDALDDLAGRAFDSPLSRAVDVADI